MPGLKLKLRPEEQLLINGSVIQNGHYPVELIIKTPNTHILRLRDALHPDEVNTPTRRVCYIAQLVVGGSITAEAALEDFLAGAKQLLEVFRDKHSIQTIQQAIDFAKDSNFYRAMHTMRKVMKYEDLLMARMKLLGEMETVKKEAIQQEQDIRKKA